LDVVADNISPTPDAADAGGNPDGSVTTIDGGGPLTVVDIGTNDLRVDLTSDGTIALLEDGTTGDMYFYNTTTGALTKNGNVGHPGYGQATSISGDGSRVGASHAVNSIRGGIYGVGAASWVDLNNTYAAGCPNTGGPTSESAVFDLNANGSVAVGDVWNNCTTAAMLRTDVQGTWTPTPLAHLGMAGGNNHANSVSDYGTVIGGWALQPQGMWDPAVWKSDGTGVLLDPTGKVYGFVSAVSPDGKMVAGQWDSTAGPSSFYWTSAAGVVMVGSLPNPVANDFVWLNAIASNNQLILGCSGDPTWVQDAPDGSEEFAVVWTQASGMRKLQDIVTAQHIAIPAHYDLTGINAASNDGTVVLGFATDMSSATFQQHTFVLRMPVSAYGL
jgi:hypothetical protein